MGSFPGSFLGLFRGSFKFSLRGSKKVKTGTIRSRVYGLRVWGLGTRFGSGLSDYFSKQRFGDCRLFKKPSATVPVKCQGSFTSACIVIDSRVCVHVAPTRSEGV